MRLQSQTRVSDWTKLNMRWSWISFSWFQCTSLPLRNEVWKREKGKFALQQWWTLSYLSDQNQHCLQQDVLISYSPTYDVMKRAYHVTVIFSKIYNFIVTTKSIKTLLRDILKNKSDQYSLIVFWWWCARKGSQSFSQIEEN